MSEQKSVSPLLDGFTIGTPVNDHYGVCCYPAVKANSERKYIVKVISIPASQTQLDALLITGAYKDPAAAAEYFHDVSDRIVQEAEFLKTMSRLEGFIPYEGYQVEPMTKNRLGYEVYLLSGFRLSLERYMHRHTVTHLEAVNLGIDMCAALAACRRAGMMYIDLKPANIFISTKKEYKIGDLGFASLNSLKFNSMPEKYRSVYTAPELQDDLNVLNTTADTYAAGMILYQIFNNGILPDDPTTPMPAPANADEAMAEIILKAIAPEVENRWADPVEMGQALVDYMQGGTVNDTPLMEPILGSALGITGAGYETTKFPSADVPAPVPEKAAEAPAAEAVEPEAPKQEAPAEEITEEPAQEDVQESVPEEVAEAPAEDSPEEPVEESHEDAAEEANEEPAEPEEVNPELLTDADAYVDALLSSAEQETAEQTDPESDMEAAAAAEFAELAASIPQEEPAPEGERLDSELKELNKILKKEKPAKKKKKQENIKPVIVAEPKKKRSPVKVLFTILLICLLTAGGVFGYLFYQTEYLQTINKITIQGAQDTMTVYIDSTIDENLLTVICTDTFGHAVRQRVRDGKSTFTQLSPASLYKVNLEVSGLHKLVGQLSDIYTTESVTNVASFTAAVGPEDGSVMLNLVVDGHEPNQWQIIYSAEGMPELGHTFSGHTTTITNLAIGKEYTFKLETGKHDAVNGQNSVVFTPGNVVTARNLRITSFRDGVMVVSWDPQEGEETESWRVRCYGDGYDQVVDGLETQATFTGVDSNTPYTIEVTAKSMTQSAKIVTSVNPVTLTSFMVNEQNNQALDVSWTFEGNAPEGGWRLSYTLDGSDLPIPAICNGATATIEPMIPGAVYHFTVQGANDVSVFNNAHTYSAKNDAVYTANGFGTVQVSCQMLITPANEDWNVWGVSGQYTSYFQVGQPLSIVLSADRYFQQTDVPVHILYVFRDAGGNALPEMIAEEDTNWYALWNSHSDYQHAELNLPVTPTRAGNYNLDIYFDGCHITTANFTVN